MARTPGRAAPDHRSEKSRVVSYLALIGILLLGVTPARAEDGPATAGPGFRQTGIASWYGHPYHGRRTSSGEVYDMRRMTAAHPSLPLGTRVRVTNLDNGRSVEVRVNVRGPFRRGRIIDLSRAAAERLGGRRGLLRVRVEVIALPETVARSDRR